MFFGDGYAEAFAEHTEGVGVGGPLEFHDESYGASALAAAEAVEEAFGGVDAEGGCFLVVEGAASHEVSPSACEFDVVADDRDDVIVGDLGYL